MPAPTSVTTEAAPAPFQGAPYSQAIKAGDFVFVSGQLGLKPGDTAISGSIQEQTEQVFQNLEAILEAAGSGLDRLVKTTVFLANLSDFQGMNEIYASRVGEQQAGPLDRRGRRALRRGALVEIEAIASPLTLAASSRSRTTSARSGSTRTSSAARCATSCSGSSRRTRTSSCSASTSTVCARCSSRTAASRSSRSPGRPVGVRLWPRDRELRELVPGGIEFAPPRRERSTGPGTARLRDRRRRVGAGRGGPPAARLHRERDGAPASTAATSSIRSAGRRTSTTAC